MLTHLDQQLNILISSNHTWTFPSHLVLLRICFLMYLWPYGHVWHWGLQKNKNCKIPWTEIRDFRVSLAQTLIPCHFSSFRGIPKILGRGDAHILALSKRFIHCRDPSTSQFDVSVTTEGWRFV